MSAISIRLGGKSWLSAIGPYGEVEVVDRWPGGCWSLSWQMMLPPGIQPSALTAGTRVEAFAAGRRFSGTLAEPDWDSGEFHADGLVRQGESALALGLPGLTANPGDAIFFAAARNAIAWGAMETFTPVSAEATELNYISALMDAYADQVGRRWAVTENGLVYTAQDPTTPTLFITPSAAADLGVSQQTQVTHLFGRYLKTDLSYDTVTAAPSSVTPLRIERAVDLTARGPLTTFAAQGVVDNILAKVGVTTQFTSGIEVVYGQVTNRRGVPEDLTQIRAGLMARAQGVPDPRNGQPSTDFVIGETVLNERAGTVQINPVEIVAADFAAIVEEMGGVVTL